MLKVFKVSQALKANVGMSVHVVNAVKLVLKALKVRKVAQALKVIRVIKGMKVVKALKGIKVQ